MKAKVIHTYRDGTEVLRQVLILKGPDNNGLVTYQRLNDDGEPIPHLIATCRIANIQNGKLLWPNWPNNLLKKWK